MINIRSAKLSDVQFIADSLSTYFDKINTLFSYPKYKTDISIMTKAVTERIQEDNPEFLYYIAEEDGNAKGFANILISEEKSEILVIDGMSEEIKSNLLDYVLDIFNQNGIKLIYGETFPIDTLSTIIGNKGAKVIKNTYKLEL